MSVIVVSDESDDGTDEIVRGIDDARVRLVRQEPRAGKTSGLNLIAPLATGEILITSDANSFYAPDTVGELVQPLADPAGSAEFEQLLSRDKPFKGVIYPGRYSTIGHPSGLMSPMILN